MRKYRIVELNNKFYPQEKKYLCWRYIDNLVAHIMWRENHIDESMCESKEDAEKIINARIKFIEKSKRVIHEYKQQDK